MAAISKIVTLKSITTSLKIAPKSARRILRKSDATPAPLNGARWTWTPADAAKVRTILKSA